MRLINRLRFTYSIIFLIIGLVLGYLIWGGILGNITTAFQATEEQVMEESIINESTNIEEIAEETNKDFSGFATIASSDYNINDLVIFGFEGLEPLEDAFYEGWIVEFKDNEAVAKISTGKFNINSDGFIVNADGKLINIDDPASATFSQVGTNDNFEWPVNLLDKNREFRIVITIESRDEPLDDLTPSEEVILSGKVTGNKVIILKLP